MLLSIFLFLFWGCSVSSYTPSSDSQEAKIRTQLKKLQEKTHAVYQKSHQLESDIDDIRRNAAPHSPEAIQELENQIKELRGEQEALKKEFMDWKLQLNWESSKQ